MSRSRAISKGQIIKCSESGDAQRPDYTDVTWGQVSALMRLWTSLTLPETETQWATMRQLNRTPGRAYKWICWILIGTRCSAANGLQGSMRLYFNGNQWTYWQMALQIMETLKYWHVYQYETVHDVSIHISHSLKNLNWKILIILIGQVFQSIDTMFDIWILAGLKH